MPAHYLKSKPRCGFGDLVIASLGLLACGLAYGDAPFSAPRDEQDIEIRTYVDEQAAIGRAFTIIPSTNPVTVEVRASDLVSTDDETRIIPRTAISVQKPAAALELSKPADFFLSIANANVKFVGTYKGYIEVYKTNNYGLDKVLRLNVVLYAQQHPHLTVSKETSSITRRLTRHGFGDALLDWLFVGEGELQRDDVVSFEPAESQVTVQDVSTILKGKVQGTVLVDKLVTTSEHPTFMPSRKAQLNIKYAPEDIPPDEYSGSAYVSLKGSNSRVAIPVFLTVRLGPLLPFVVIAIGVALGRVYKWIQGDGAARIGLLQRHYQLGMRVGLEVDESDRELLQEAITKARLDIYESKTADAEALLKKLDNRVDLLAALRRIRTATANWTDKPKTDADTAIKLLTDSILSGDDDTAAKAMKTLQDLLKNPPTPIHAGLQKQLPNLINNTVGLLPQNLPTTGKGRQWLRMLPAKIQGYIVETGLMANFIMPGILVLFLIYGGMRLYYATGAFGADMSANIMAALAYGFSADVLSRTLGTALVNKAPG
jgi:hypothetical protein